MPILIIIPVLIFGIYYIVENQKLNKKLKLFEKQTFKKKTMKKNYLLLLFITQFGFSQAPVIEWQKCIGGSAHDDPKSIIQTSDGGYIVAGKTKSTDFDILDNHGGYDILVAKLDVTGNIQWKKCYGGTQDEFANCIIQTTDGGYIIGGDTSSNDGDVVGNNFGFIGIANHAWVIKINNIGEIQWQKMPVSSVGETNSSIRSIIETSLGNFILGGDTYFPDNGNGYGDIYISTLAANGSSYTTLNIVGGGFNDNLHSMSQTNDGGFILAGLTTSRDGIYSVNHGTGAVSDYWIIKVNSSGIVQWQKLYGGSGNDDANSVIQTSDGGYIVAGYTSSNNDGDVTGNHSSGYYDYWIIKLDNLGNLEWQKCYGSLYYDVAFNILQNSDGGYTVAGYARETAGGNATGNHGNSDFWIARLTSNGTIIWEKSIGGSGWDEAYCIKKTSDDGFIVCGIAASNNQDVVGFHGTNTFYNDFWVVKLSPENLSNNKNQKKQLSIFPNPSKSLLNIQLSNDEIVDKVIITDLLGKKLLEETVHTTQLNVEHLAKGTYLIQAYSGDKKLTSKFIKE